MAEEAVSKDAEQAVVGVEDESGAIWSGHLCVSSDNEIIKNGVGIVGGGMVAIGGSSERKVRHNQLTRQPQLPGNG